MLHTLILPKIETDFFFSVYLFVFLGIADLIDVPIWDSKCVAFVPVSLSNAKQLILPNLASGVKISRL